ncbi:MAG: hypothetical protein MK193_01765 [Lentisphaeria bacterium]|nr:hypothetical protein [Lentisphaeria bacterium]
MIKFFSFFSFFFILGCSSTSNNQEKEVLPVANLHRNMKSKYIFWDFLKQDLHRKLGIKNHLYFESDPATTPFINYLNKTGEKSKLSSVVRVKVYQAENEDDALLLYNNFCSRGDYKLYKDSNHKGKLLFLIHYTSEKDIEFTQIVFVNKRDAQDYFKTIESNYKLKVHYAKP